MRFVVRPAVYQMRNKRLAWVQRLAVYDAIDDRGRKVKAKILEGCELDSDQLMMWNESGHRIPKFPGAKKQDLIRRVRAEEEKRGIHRPSA